MKARSFEIIQDEQELRQPSEKATLDEAKQITEHLWSTLNERKEGDVGLAAPQIGIKKQVCIVRAKKPFVLVNPQIIESNGDTWFQEGCLSFPNKSIRTRRFTDITVKADYLGEGSGSIEWFEDVTLGFQNDDNFDMKYDTSLLECVAVQHEIAHLQGKLMFDFEWKPIKVVKIKPNEKCQCQSGLKYKKCCGKL